MPAPLRVLIVEDNPDDCELMVLHLTEAGFQPDWQRVEIEADYLAALEPAPDLILSDWRLPNFSGKRALQLLAERDLDIPFVIVSGIIGEEAAIEAIHQGADDYVLKDRPARLGLAAHRAIEANELRKARKQAEAALKEKVEALTRLATVVSDSNDAVIMHDLEGKILAWNRGAKEIYGYSETEALGKNVRDIVAETDREAARSLIQRIKQGERVKSFELRRVTKVGRILDVWLTTTLLTDEEGKPMVIATTERDITERKRAEEALQQSKINLAEAQRIAHIGSYEYDVLHDQLHWSDEGFHIYGISPQEFSGRAADFFERIHPEDRQRVQETIEQTIATTGKGKIEYRIIRPDGIERIIQELFEVTYEHGERVRQFGTIQDITERKRAEEALKESEGKFRGLVEQSSDGIVIIDEKGMISEWNQGQEQISGLKAADVHGRPLWEVQFQMMPDELKSPAMLNRLKKNIHSFLVSKKSDQLNGMIEMTIQLPDGKRREVQIVNFQFKTDLGFMAGSISRDITERKRVEDALRKSEDRFRALIENGSDEVSIIAADGTLLYESPSVGRTLGYVPGEFLGKSLFQLVYPDDLERIQSTFAQLLQDASLHPREQFRLRHRDGTWRWVDAVGTNLLAEPSVSGIVLNYHDITERKQAEEALKKLSSAVEQTADNIFITDREGSIEYVNPAFEQLTGYSKEEAIGKTPRILKSGLQSAKDYEELWATILAGKVVQSVVANRKKNGELYYEEKTINPLRNEQGNVTHFVSTGKDVTDRMQRERELEAIATVSAALRTAQTLDEMLPLLLDVTLGVMRATQGAIWLYDPVKDELRAEVTRGWDDAGEHPIPTEKPGEGVNGYVFATGQPYVASDLHLDPRLPETVRQWIQPGMGGAVIPIRAGENAIGTFNVNVSLPRELTPGEVHVLTTLSEIAGNAIQRTRLLEMTQQDAQRLASLHSIDVAISGSMDLHLTLNILLGQVVGLLKVSAASILLFNPHTLWLEYSAGIGFRSSAIEKSRLRIGEGYAGRAALERRTINAPDLRIADSEFARKKLLAGEEFVAYFGVPLITKGKVIGVLDIFNCSPLVPDPKWLDFMEALASQAAIAIDSGALFENLQRSNFELMMAYDETIEGWSHAMDLRDKETEGHTLRVTEMTLKLANSIGIRGEELANYRRGALLHDIGKMGVPDGILLKPGPLNDEEWVIMRKHPQFAHDMLVPIAYLRPALDIPYCHHEKWDGKGYPRGLKGEEIPLAARIFAVVDVWDALTSDRPYRKAWPEEKVREHIQAGSGTHFDPQVVKTFLESEIIGSIKAE